MKKTARKLNVTGIKRLSIGQTTNDRGYIMHRYLVTIPKEDGKLTTKSFYFGKSATQLAAFLNAVRFLKAEKVWLGTLEEARKIYKQYEHECLIHE